MMESNADIKFTEFKQQVFNELQETEKYNSFSNLTIKDLIPLYPKMVSKVAKIVTALPPTQVRVERLFSALRLIKSDLRASLKDDLTEAILFLGMNWDSLKPIFSIKNNRISLF